MHRESVIITRVETHTLETRGTILVSNSIAVVKKSKRRVFLSPSAHMQPFSAVAISFIRGQICSLHRQKRV